MSTKKYTFFIVSSDQKATRRVTVSAAVVRAAAFVAVIGVSLVFAAVVDYLGLMVQSMENKRLVAENAMLRQNFEIVESKLASLEGSLERVRSFYTKLKMITNVEDRERVLKLAIGPLPKPGQNLAESPYRAPSAQHMDSHTDHAEPTMDGMAAEQPPGNEYSFGEVPPDKTDNEVAAFERSDFSTIAVRIDRAVSDSQLREQNIIDLWQSLSERRTLLSSTPSIKPARGWLTSRFGYRTDPFSGRIVMHNGLDIAAAPGSPVYAPADGVVSFAGYDEAYGRLVSIDHGYGVMTRFAHNSRLFVSVGQRVKRWDVISAVGNTGRSTGPHLHYEVRVNNVSVDPANYILD